MKLYTVWPKKSLSGGLSEKCLMTTTGDFVGQNTGTLYSQRDYYTSEQFSAIIVAVDKTNNTGMYHLSESWAEDRAENARTRKQKYVGCHVTVEKAHKWGAIQVYRCNELTEYFSEYEINLMA